MLKNTPKNPHIFSNSTRTNVFNLELLQGSSYNHWIYLKKFKRGVIFNQYTYSNTTSKHQRELRKLLDELHIKIKYEVCTPHSLSNIQECDLYRYIINKGVL